MKVGNRILIGIGCLALLLVSWIVAVSAPSNAEKQLSLIERAEGLMRDEIYISAVPLLEEAAGYRARHTATAESMLKEAYLQMIEQQGYLRKYTSLLDRQMDREDAAPEIFFEAANFYLERSKLNDALTVLKNGMEKTGSEELAALYEKERYAYVLSRVSYEQVTALYGNTVQVMRGGAWGLAMADGTLVIPCEYDKISTYSGRAIVKKDGVISAVDANNNRVALLHEAASDFKNYGNDRIGIRTDTGWRRANGALDLGAASFEEIGMYASGYVAARQNGKWGVLGMENDWLIPPEYDGIIQDELGRCCAQKAVFVRQGGDVFLFVDGKRMDGAYEDARPFADGYAAVRRDGKWGFIDTSGAVAIDFQFDDALSFGQHLAAVRDGELWGYISRSGAVAIEPVFLEAKSFSSGSAPVRTEKGWQFITLLEYQKGAGL